MIADYNLPGSNHGLQLLGEIRRITPAVRLILWSGYIDSTDVAAVESLGLVDRAIAKTAEGVTAMLIEEIAAAKERAAAPTDWVAYAKLHREARGVDQSELAQLDDRLKKSRGIG